jgi:alanine-glyoxylate transaminase / serine-glyoxylate transaminase / serine-pyruvate transaminase
VLVVQIDTASGVANDIAAIGHAIRAASHDALLMVGRGGFSRLHAF